MLLASSCGEQSSPTGTNDRTPSPGGNPAANPGGNGSNGGKDTTKTGGTDTTKAGGTDTTKAGGTDTTHTGGTDTTHTGGTDTTHTGGTDTTHTGGTDTTHTGGTDTTRTGGTDTTNTGGPRGFQPSPIQCTPPNQDQWYRTDNTLIVDRQNPSILYVNVEWKGFYKSTDGGATWTRKTNGLVSDFTNVNTGEACYTEYPVAVQDPVNPNRILLGGSAGGGGTINDMNAHAGGIWESVDGGESWRQTINETMNAYVTHALVIDPRNPQTFYYGTAASPASYMEADPNKIWVTQGIIYKTGNGGRTWSELPTGFVKHARLSFIAVNPENSSVLTASAVVMVHNPFGPNTVSSDQLGIIQSRDGGLSWQRIDNLPTPATAALFTASSSRNGNNFFHTAATNGGDPVKSYYSTDGGHTWRLSSRNMEMVSYDPNDASGNRLVGYNWQCMGPCGMNLYQSTDAGATWTAFGTLPAEITNIMDHKTRIQHLVWHPTDPHSFYLSGANGYVWKTTNDAQTWTTLLSLSKLH